MAHSAQSRNSWILGNRHAIAAGAAMREAMREAMHAAMHETFVQRLVLNVSFDA